MRSPRTASASASARATCLRMVLGGGLISLVGIIDVRVGIIDISLIYLICHDRVVLSTHESVLPDGPVSVLENK